MELLPFIGVVAFTGSVDAIGDLFADVAWVVDVLVCFIVAAGVAPLRLFICVGVNRACVVLDATSGEMEASGAGEGFVSVKNGY